MATVALTQFFDEVLPDLPGCPEEFALNAIRNAAILFCDRTKVHRIDLDPILLLANVPQVDFILPASAPQTRVVQVLQAQYGEDPLDFKDPDWLDKNLDPNWRTTTGEPLFITQDSEESFRPVPFPAADATLALTLYVAVKPTADATLIDARLWREHKEAIAAGAKARLMMSPKKPYTNAALASVYSEAFESAIWRINHKATKGHGRARIRTTAHFM